MQPRLWKWGTAAGVTLALAGGVAQSTVLAKSAPHRTGARPVTITYWAGHSSGALHAAVVAEVSRFNRTHPAIHVVFRDTGASHHALAAFEAGQAPNVGMVSSYIVPQFLHAGAILNLTPFIHGKNGLTAAQIRSDYYPAVWRAMQGPAGKQYLLPLEKKSLVVIYFNQPLLRKVGIKSPPRTWAQVGADAAKITRLGHKYHGIAWTPSLRQFFDIVVADGGSVFASGHPRTAFSLDNAGARRALTMLRSWVKSGSMVLTSGYQYQLDFGTGDVGMLIDASAGYTYDKSSVGGKFAMGGVSAPAGTSHHSAQYINGTSLVLFNVGSQAQKAAAWTFMKWLSSPVANVYWDEHTNYLPLGPAEDAQMRSFYAKNPDLAASFSNPAHWWYKPRVPGAANYEAAKTNMETPFMKALLGQLTVPAALSQMTHVGTQYLSGKVRG